MGILNDPIITAFSITVYKLYFFVKNLHQLFPFIVYYNTISHCRGFLSDFASLLFIYFMDILFQIICIYSQELNLVLLVFYQNEWDQYFFPNNLRVRLYGAAWWRAFSAIILKCQWICIVVLAIVFDVLVFDVRLTWDWREIDVRLTWDWREIDVRLTWDWHEIDVPVFDARLMCLCLTWDWHEIDMRLTWDWREIDVRLTWDWHEIDMRLTWDWHEIDVRLTWDAADSQEKKGAAAAAQKNVEDEAEKKREFEVQKMEKLLLMVRQPEPNKEKA